jgi:Zn-dependent oligopeptidase
MLENWMWNDQILSRVSSHVETGEPLPAELIKKKLAIKNLNEAYFTLRQLFYGTFDFVLHSAVDENLLKLEAEESNYSITKVRKDLKKNGNRVNTRALWYQLKPIMNF